MIQNGPMNVAISCWVKASIMLRVPIASEIIEVHPGVHVFLSNDEDHTHEVVVPKLDINACLTE